MTRRALFLDKDGVINVDHGHVCTPGRTDFIGGIFHLCRTANRRGWLVAVVTNQAAIGRGHCSEGEFLTYMDWVRSRFRVHDARLDAVYYCPHHPVHGRGNYKSACACRKPEPGMLRTARQELDLDMSVSLLLGDNDSDIKAGVTAGVGTCLGARTLVDDHSGRTVFDADFMRKVTSLLNTQPVVARNHGQRR